MVFDVRRVAELARLRLPAEEEETVGRQMAAIIKMVEYLPSSGGEDVLLKTDNLMQLRKDEVLPSQPQEEILKNAPKVAAGYFVVPKILE